MEDEKSEDKKPEGAAEEQGSPGIQLLITSGPRGMEITGPIDDPLLCYGLLEAAKDLVRLRMAQRQAAAAPRIVRPDLAGGIPGVTRVRH